MGRLIPRSLLLATLAMATASTALAQQGPPRRQIPPSVLAELAVLEQRFEAALAADCDARQCFSKGCIYVAHAVADRPASTSLPGLGGDPGPSPTDAQAWLTQARCSLAIEASVEPDDVQTLVRRLQARVSTGWTVVTVGHQAMQALPAGLREPPAPPEEPEPEPAPAPEPEPLTMATAGRQLWDALLGHAYWMFGLGLLTICATTLLWAWRRVGRDSLEEQALLAQLAAGGPDDLGDQAPSGGARPEGADDQALLARQAAAWRLRLEQMDPERPDPDVQAMLRELLRAGELPLLAKAVLTFPERLPAAFPSGGDVATAKLELAEFLKRVDVDALPSDAELFRTLDRHALAATLATQRDAEIVRSLREEFGPAGLVDLLERVPARAGALLLALAPTEAQHEVARLLSPDGAARLAEQLLLSNRIDATETAYLFDVLEAARTDATMPPTPASSAVSDHGVALDASGALSVLLGRVDAGRRTELIDGALRRFGGSLPAWVRGLVLPEMLLHLPDEARSDLLLEVDVEGLAAWLSLVDVELGRRLVASAPNALRASVRAASVFPSRERQLALADAGRRELAKGLQTQLARLQIPFEQVVGPVASGGA